MTRREPPDAVGQAPAKPPRGRKRKRRGTSRTGKARGDMPAIAAYLSDAIAASGKTQALVAAEIGLGSANMVSMMARGSAKVPLERIPALARAIGADPKRMFVLGLVQYSKEYADAAEAMFGNVVNDAEMALVRRYRTATGWMDPTLTTNESHLVARVLTVPPATPSRTP